MIIKALFTPRQFNGLIEFLFLIIWMIALLFALLFFNLKFQKMFDIEAPDYEEKVIFWIRHNLSFLEGADYHSVTESITCNVDFINLKVHIAMVGSDVVVLFELPDETDFRVYYPTEIRKLKKRNGDFVAYKVDNLFWFYREQITNSIFFYGTLCSFGMDMTLPFLDKFLT